MSKTAFILDISKLPKESWRPIAVENQRTSSRINEREIERIATWIRSEKNPKWKAVRLRDYSLFGFGIYCDYQSGLAFPISIGEAVELKVVGSDKKEIIVACQVQNSGAPGQAQRIGLKRLDLEGLEKTASANFPDEHIVNREKPLRVRIANPFLYEEWADAGLIGLGPGNIWIFESTDSALLLLPGQTLNIALQLPSSHSGICSGDILWSTAREGDRLLFAVKPMNLSFELNNALGEYFVQDWECKPVDLAGYGVKVKRFKEQLHFTFVSTQEEYSQVLSLRRNAYVHAGKREAATAPEQLASLFDPQSRILVAFHQNVMVASLTLNFSKDGNSHFRSEGEFPGNKYPVSVPPKGKMIEAHSFCTHKDYRGGDLFQGMIEHTLRCLLLSDRDWIITLVTDELWPLYQRMGCKKTGASIRIHHLNDMEHHLILIHRNAVLYGEGMKLFDWNYFYGDLMKDILQKRLLEIPLWRNGVVRALDLMDGFFRKRMNRKLETDFRRYMRKMNEKED